MARVYGGSARQRRRTQERATPKPQKPVSYSARQRRRMQEAGTPAPMRTLKKPTTSRTTGLHLRPGQTYGGRTGLPAQPRVEKKVTAAGMRPITKKPETTAIRPTPIYEKTPKSQRRYIPPIPATFGKRATPKRKPSRR